MRNNLRPLLVIEPKQSRIHALGLLASTKLMNHTNLVWVWTLVKKQD
jgi:hypothetical protein